MDTYAQQWTEVELGLRQEDVERCVLYVYVHIQRAVLAYAAKVQGPKQGRKYSTIHSRLPDEPYAWRCHSLVPWDSAAHNRIPFGAVPVVGAGTPGATDRDQSTSAGLSKKHGYRVLRRMILGTRAVWRSIAGLGGFPIPRIHGCIPVFRTYTPYYYVRTYVVCGLGVQRGKQGSKQTHLRVSSRWRLGSHPEREYLPSTNLGRSGPYLLRIGGVGDQYVRLACA
jgi:hypothetical protein